MRERASSTIKTRLVRSGLYLLLLVAGSAISFAVAQRAAPLSVAGAGAGAQVPASPTASGGDYGSHPDTILPEPRTPQVVLYDQYDNASAAASLSATFTDFPTFNADLVDDFVVPAGQNWQVSSIDADGVYFNGPGPAIDWNVFIYSNNSGLPGAVVYSTLNQPVSVNGTTFTVTLSSPACLPAGHYWIEIQANMTFTPAGEWGWTDRTVQSNSPAAWQNPGGGFGVCPSWTAKTTCIPTAGGPDQVFRINGTIGPCGGGSCSNYGTRTGSATLTAGTTDIGNHCDDCATSFSFPFPVSVYGQNFTSASAASNGTLNLAAPIAAPFTHGCLALPNAFWGMAILPYQDDLRTDNLGWVGCAGFPGGTCGIFTVITGSAPNRIFHLEWRAVHFADTAAPVDFELAFYENNPSAFDVVYGATNDHGSDETSGAQEFSAGAATTFSCGLPWLTEGLKVTYDCSIIFIDGFESGDTARWSATVP